MIKGHKPSVFIDKLGDRFGFERAGVRLYDALLAKFDASQSWEGGPTRERLAHIREEELAHFFMIKEAIEKLGGDPTVMTPSADVSAVASMGIFKVATDPRTTLLQSLHATLIAERADVDGWDGLIALAEGAGEDKLGKQFSRALKEENEHVAFVKEWVAKGMSADLRRDLGH
jgi:ferritin-like protein